MTVCISVPEYHHKYFFPVLNNKKAFGLHRSQVFGKAWEEGLILILHAGLCFEERYRRNNI